MRRQGRRKLFHVAGGGLSKNVDNRGCPTTKNYKKNNKKKKNWLKSPKDVPKKWTLDQNINDSKTHIWDSFFEILFWVYQWTWPEFFSNFIFSSRKSQSQQKLVKKITHFTIQFHLKILVHFMNLNLDLHDIENNTLPQHSQKLFSLYKFSRKYVSALC